MRTLLLEERIAIVREALNVGSMRFLDGLSEDLNGPFKEYVHDLISVLDGDIFSYAQLRLTKRPRGEDT